MRAATLLAQRLHDEGLLLRVTRVRSELFGTLGVTGHGHGNKEAVRLGLTFDVVRGLVQLPGIERNAPQTSGGCRSDP